MDDEEHISGGNPKRRQLRTRRVNAMDFWQKGVIDDTPVRERWSREFRDPRVKKLKDPVEDVPEDRQYGGLAVEVHRRTCEVRLDREDQSGNRVVRAIYRAKVIEELGEFPAVGDRVIVGRHNDEEQYSLLRVLSRRTALVRPGPRDRLGQQLTLAANVDQVVLVCAVAQPEFNYGFADRFLLATSLSRLPLIMVLNKMDLSEQIPEEITDFLSLVDRFIPVSCSTGQGLEELRAILNGRFSVFSGQSGVGKSSLINALVPGAGLRTGSVRAKDGKGRHTTTASSLFMLPQGGAVIDTPGIRALGLVNLNAADLARSFPGFFPDGLFTCRFNDCLHRNEPGCAVLEGVRTGRISPARWRSYLRILNSGD